MNFRMEYNGDVCDFTVDADYATCCVENSGVVRISYYRVLTKTELEQFGKQAVIDNTNPVTGEPFFDPITNECTGAFKTNGGTSVTPINSTMGLFSCVDSNGLKEGFYRMGCRDRYDAFIESHPDFGGIVKAHYTISAKIPFATNSKDLYDTISFTCEGENIYISELFARAMNMDTAEASFVDTVDGRLEFTDVGSYNSQYWTNRYYAGTGAMDSRTVVTNSIPLGDKAGFFNGGSDCCVYESGEIAQICNQFNTTSQFNTPIDGDPSRGYSTWENIRLGNGMIFWVLAEAIAPVNRVSPKWELYSDGTGFSMDLTLVLTNYESVRRKYENAIIKSFALKNYIYPETGINGGIASFADVEINEIIELPFVKANSIDYSSYVAEGGAKTSTYSFIIVALYDSTTGQQLTQQCCSNIPFDPTLLPLAWQQINGNYSGKNTGSANNVNDTSWIHNILNVYEEDKYEDKDETSDTIEDSTGYNTAGLLTNTYALTPQRTQQIGERLWSAGIFDQFELINNSPIENIVSAKAFPFPIEGELNDIYCGNVDMKVDGLLVSDNWNGFKRTIGEIKVEGYYECFLDYEPFTKLAIFLPFIGFKMLDCSLFMGKYLKVVYIVDIVTGACKAVLYADGTPVNSFDGEIGIDIPLTASNRAQVEAGYISSFIDTIGNVASLPEAVASGGGGAVGGVTNVAGGIWDAIASNQFHAQTGGGVSPQCSAFETRDCFLIYDRPMYQEISQFAHTHGKLCRLSRRIGGLSGFTMVTPQVDLSGVPCTEAEEKELRSILTTGFYA